MREVQKIDPSIAIVARSFLAFVLIASTIVACFLPWWATLLFSLLLLAFCVWLACSTEIRRQSCRLLGIGDVGAFGGLALVFCVGLLIVWASVSGMIQQRERRAANELANKHIADARYYMADRQLDLAREEIDKALQVSKVDEATQAEAWQVAQELQRAFADREAERQRNINLARQNVANSQVEELVTQAKKEFQDGQFAEAEKTLTAALAVEHASEPGRRPAVNLIAEVRRTIADNHISSLVFDAGALLTDGMLEAAQAKLKQAVAHRNGSEQRMQEALALYAEVNEKVGAQLLQAAEASLNANDVKKAIEHWTAYVAIPDISKKESISKLLDYAGRATSDDRIFSMLMALGESDFAYVMQHNELPKSLAAPHPALAKLEKSAIGRRLTDAAATRRERATRRIPSQPSTVSRRNWYENGTLHKASALKWQQADYGDKLATCADFVSNLWASKKFVSRIQNSIRTVDDMRPLASELVTLLDEATRPDSDAERNRRMFANQEVSSLAVIGMTLAGWLKR